MTAVAHVTPQAQHWLGGRAVTLYASLRHGCCGGHAELPIAHAGAPDDRSRYRVEVVEGVEVFVDERLTDVLTGPVTVAVDGWARWRRLVVLDGVHQH
jgi:hypothetical protein